LTEDFEQAGSSCKRTNKALKGQKREDVSIQEKRVQSENTLDNADSKNGRVKILPSFPNTTL